VTILLGILDTLSAVAFAFAAVCVVGAIASTFGRRW
jgi:hypothetical protein